MADGATDKTHSTLIPPPGQEGAALKDGVIPQAAGVPSEFARRAETLQQINLFIRTRWWVVVACLAVLLLGMQTRGLDTPPIPPLLTLLTVALYNIAFEVDHWWCMRAGEQAEMDRVYRSANVQIDVDLVALSVLVYFTGGPYSPFALLYVLHTITAAFLLSRFETFLQATLALGLFGLVGLVHAAAPDWLNVSTGPRGVPSVAYTATVLAALALTVYGVAWLGTLLVQRNRETTDQLRARVNIDGLTGLFNYGYFADQLDVEMERARRFGHSVSLVMVDMDGLKRWNDLQGHLMGSQALKEIGAILKDCSRSVDIPAKYGGDEFALILPETSKCRSRHPRRACLYSSQGTFVPAEWGSTNRPPLGVQWRQRLPGGCGQYSGSGGEGRLGPVRGEAERQGPGEGIRRRGVPRGGAAPPRLNLGPAKPYDVPREQVLRVRARISSRFAASYSCRARPLQGARREHTDSIRPL